MQPPLSIIVCATPRSGSTLLCAMLAKSGVGGRPESWYRAEDRAYYEQEWALPRGADDRVDPRDYLAAAIRAGTGADGTCGLRLQAGTLQPFLAEMRTLFAGAGTDLGVIEAAFGPCKFIRTRREDSVAQAVSRLKAEQTQVWHLDGRENAAAARPEYDADRIDYFRTETAEGDALWDEWFLATGIAPATRTYETLSVDPEGCFRGIMNEIGLSIPLSATLTVPNRRMADGQSAEWAARYRTERGLG